MPDGGKMAGEKLPLLLGRGLREGPLASEDYRLVFAGQDFELADVGMSKTEKLVVGTCWTCNIAYDAKRQSLYFAFGGIDAVALHDRARRRVADAPLIGLAEKGSHFIWLLALAPDASRIVSLAMAEKGEHEIVVIDPEGGILSSFPLDGWPAGVSVDFGSQRICQPGHKEGPRVLDFDGHVVATTAPLGVRKILQRLRPQRPASWVQRRGARGGNGPPRAVDAGRWAPSARWQRQYAGVEPGRLATLVHTRGPRSVDHRAEPR